MSQKRQRKTRKIITLGFEDELTEPEFQYIFNKQQKDIPMDIVVVIYQFLAPIMLCPQIGDKDIDQHVEDECIRARKRIKMNRERRVEIEKQWKEFQMSQKNISGRKQYF